MADNFIWVVGQCGFEKAIKDAASKHHPQLTAAFQRPGFVSFKSPTPVRPDFVFCSPLARAFAVSLGRVAPDVTAVREQAERIGVARYHVFSRDDFEPDESPGPEPLFAPARAVEAQLGVGETVAVVGEHLLDVCLVEPNEWWLGHHVHTLAHSPFAGGRPRLALPKDAPSRAYLKAEEAIHWAGLPLAPGQTALELGSAPGGAVWALLQRGLHVVGVDPGDMAAQALAHERYRHVTCAVAEVPDEAWPRHCDWLFVDLNLAPIKSLHAIERALPFIKRHLRGMVVTFKIHGGQQIAEVERYQRRLASFGFSKVAVRQLGFNRRELCVVAQR